ncbi:MAG: hypothetical protein ACKOWD_01880 [Rhodoferax sp.]
MGISAVRGSAPAPAPRPQRVDTQRTLELRQQNQAQDASRRASSPSVAMVNQSRAAAPKDKGNHVDVRA